MNEPIKKHYEATYYLKGYFEYEKLTSISAAKIKRYIESIGGKKIKITPCPQVTR